MRVIYDFVYEVEQEKDGRFIAEIPAIPGAMAYGENKIIAMSKASQIAYDRLNMRWSK